MLSPKGAAQFHRLFAAIIIFCLCGIAVAEDPNERVFQTPASAPKHASKPLVKGWSQTRVKEKFNRGLVAVPKGDGSVYLSWRLLDTDAPNIAFNVYRSAGGKLCVYTTTIPAADRRACLMQNALYRADVAHLSMGYPQPAMTDYYLGTPVADSAKAKPVIAEVVAQNSAVQPDTRDPDMHD